MPNENNHYLSCGFVCKLAACSVSSIYLYIITSPFFLLRHPPNELAQAAVVQPVPAGHQALVLARQVERVQRRPGAVGARRVAGHAGVVAALGAVQQSGLLMGVFARAVAAPDLRAAEVLDMVVEGAAHARQVGLVGRRRMDGRGTATAAILPAAWYDSANVSTVHNNFV